MNRTFALSLALLVGAGIATPARAADKSGLRPTVLNVPSGPGSVSGLGESFEVRLNSGSASETVPLQLPPGTAGMTPSLALAYDSGAGNGPVGLGWSLRTSSLQRMTERGLPRYDATDRLLLDGQELVRVAPGVWRLRSEGAFVRVRQSGVGFEVDLPSGGVRRYGLDASSRAEDGGRAFTWALEDEVDVWGNRISYFYEQDGGQPYLSEVLYNRRAGAANNRVALDYEARPDALTDYKAGFRVTTARRLSGVRVYAAGKLLRRYALTYRADAPLSLLESVRMYGDDDTTSLPAVTFRYSDAPTSLQGLTAASGAPATLPGADADTELTDVDGDGFPDVLLARTGAHAYWRNLRGKGFGPRQDVPQSPSVALGTPGVELADVDGDGLTDLLARTGSTADAFRYFPNRGRGRWEASVVLGNNPSFVPEDAQTRWVDLDGDKLPDALRLTGSSATWWRNAGAGGWAAAASLPLPPGDTVLDFADGRVKLADVNGDRLVDLVFLRTGSALWWPARGFGLFDAPETLPGAPDVGSAAEARLQLQDVTGDGLSDVLLVDADHVDIWPALPSRGFGAKLTLAGTPETNARLTQVRVGDMNGNGTPDLIWFTPTAAPEARVLYLDVTQGLRPNLLTRVENGLGMVRRVAYTTSADQYAEALDAGRPWTTRLPFSVQVVAEAAQLDSRGGEYVTRYTYADGHYDGRTREFRGFARVESRELGDADDPTAVSQHVFDLGLTHEALKGARRALEVQAADGTRFRREAWDYDAVTYATGLDGLDCVGAQARVHQTWVYEGTATPAELREEWDYDAWGNPTAHRSYGRVLEGDALKGDDELFTHRTYVNDEARWVLQRLRDERLETPAGARLAARRLYYDGPDFEGLPLGQVTRGALTREERWAEGERWVQGERLARDAFGNTVAMLGPLGATRRVEYDAATHTFPVLERLEATEGTRVEFRVGVRAGAGLVESFTDMNGSTTHFGYDALGRLTALAKPGDTLETPTLGYRYALDAPVSLRVTESRPEAGGDTLLRTLTYFDGLGRALSTLVQAEGGRWLMSDRREYSRRGAVVTEWDDALVTSSDLSMDTPRAAAVQYTYDVLGRRVRTRFPDGVSTEVRFFPLRRELWDGEDLRQGGRFQGTPLVQEEDGQGRVVAVTEDAGGGERYTTRYAYDGLGRVARVVNAAGHTSHYAYDGLGLLRSLVHPDAGQRTLTYDDAGNPLTWEDAEGQRIVKTYDSLSRLRTETHLRADGSHAGQLRYHYDAASPRLPMDAALVLGRLGWVEDLSGEDHFAYDGRGRTVQTVRVQDGKAYRTSQRYDNLDRVVGLTYPDDTSVQYVLNERGLLARVPGIVKSLEYNALGLAVRREYENGVVAVAEYDAHDRVKRLQAQDAQGRALQDVTYRYDAAGVLEGVEDAVRRTGVYSATRTYTYDALQRLTAVTGPAGDASYTYDAVGNLRSKSDVGAYAYDPDAKPNAVRAVAGSPLTYDRNGAVTAATGRRFFYDVQGRLERVEAEGAVTHYGYDAEGDRAVKRVTRDGKEHKVVYLDRYSEERDGELIKYVYAGEVRLARVGDMTTGGAALAGLTRAHRWLTEGLALGAMLGLALGAALFLVARSGPRVRWARTATAAALAAGLTSCTCGKGVPEEGPGDPATYRYYVTDHLGSSTLVTDAAGAVSTEVAYDAWGRQLAGTDEPHTYTGHEWDSDAGVYYAGTRYFDPRLGRFLTPDAEALANPGAGVQDPQFLNPYAYARNTPTSLADRDGRAAHIALGALIGAAVNTTIYVVKAKVNNEQVTVRGALGAAANGAIAGGLGAATGGASLLVQAGGAVVGSVAGGVAERAINTGSAKAALNADAMTSDAAAGAVGFGIGKVVTVVGNKAVGAVRNRLGGTASSAFTGRGCSGGTCGLPGGGCFVAGTSVALADGRSVPIEQVQVGDHVLAPGTEQAPTELGGYEVLQTSRRQVDWVVDVGLRDPTGTPERLTATLDHPFLARVGEEWQWVEAKDLRFGTVIATPTGSARVATLHQRHGPFEVFNLEVDRAHAYLVGTLRSVVHNGAQNCSAGASAAGTKNVKAYPDGSLRTPDGKFASVSGMAAPGTSAADDFAKHLADNGFDVVGREMTVRGPLGVRRYDIVLRGADNLLHGLEVKSGGAVKTAYQSFTDSWVNRFGAQGTGRLAGQNVSSATTVQVP